METELGWVLLGPMRQQQSDEVTPTRVNLLTSVHDERIESEVQILWGLETLGIQSLKGGVQKEFSENVSFEEGRYSVKLPWKESHSKFPSNYSTSLSLKLLD